MKSLKFLKYAKALSITIALCIALSACSLIEYKQEENNIPINSNGNLSVHFLDVGQGDSIFIELPGSQTMLIDAGDKMLGNGIKSYINLCGYTKIDYLVATHPHADHIGSMAYIVNNMDIGDIYMPKAVTSTSTYEKLLEAISEKGLKIKTAKNGVSILQNDDLQIEILAPITINNDNLNNCSAVIKLTYKENSFLFTGDAEKKELSTIKSDISADVLKVGHHGSKTSTTKSLLKKIKPQIAVISVGKDNDYGHPHKNALKYLESTGAKIYRTDTDNTIVITSDGSNIEAKTGFTSIEREE